ncbi:MAG: hypothetical protein NTW03_05300 [Verrucomicrobia bacterium]|nr:hypothetical protein [Verrucomicrobiota bacterium]
MTDPIVEEIRKIRDTHAAKFNYNFDAIAQDWLRQEAAAKRAGQKFAALNAKRKPRKGAFCSG